MSLQTDGPLEQSRTESRWGRSMARYGTVLAVGLLVGSLTLEFGPTGWEILSQLWSSLIIIGLSPIL